MIKETGMHMSFQSAKVERNLSSGQMPEQASDVTDFVDSPKTKSHWQKYLQSNSFFNVSNWVKCG